MNNQNIFLILSVAQIFKIKIFINLYFFCILKMEKKSLIFGFGMFLFLLIMPLAVAVNTEVKIKTAPFSEVQMNAYNAGASEFNSDSLLERYTGDSDEYGDISHDFDIVSDAFHLKIFVKKDGESLISGENFLDNPSGEFVYLEVAPKNFELIPTPGFENGTAIVNETNATEVSKTTKGTEINKTGDLAEDENVPKTVGFSVFGEEGILSKKNFFYAGGFLFLIVIVGFVVAHIKHKINASPKEIKVKKLSELQKEKKENLEDKKEDIGDYKQVIEDAERKIAEAQADIKKIKNEEKIKEMKKKIAEDEAELIRLRGGRD